AAAGQVYELSGAPLTVQVVAGKLMVWGNKNDVELIQEIIRRADTSVPKVHRFIPLKNAAAKDLAKTIGDVFTTLGRKSGLPQPREEDRVDVIADTRSNSLIVVATEERMQMAESIIRQSDEQALQIKSTIKLLPLNNRLVKDVKPVID